GTCAPTYFLSFFSRHRGHLPLHSFPPRRSSDLCAVVDPALVILSGEIGATGGEPLCELLAGGVRHIAPVHPRVVPTEVEEPVLRSEEHTSELQSREKSRMPSSA